MISQKWRRRPGETADDYQRRFKRMKRNSDRISNALAAVLVALLFAAIIGLVLWIRAAAPCWVFPLKDAPTRCLTNGGDR